MRTLDRRTFQTEELLEQYARTHDRALRDEITERHLYLAEIIARRFSGRGVDYDDLYQVAALALVKGIERFEASKGIRFVTFITPTMVGEVKNYFRDRSRTIRMPRRFAQTARLIREGKARLEQELGHSPTVDELAEALGMSEDAVLEGLEFGHSLTMVSLDADMTDDENDGTLGQILGFEDSGYDDFETGDLLARALRALDERQLQVIRGRFYENLSQRDLAARMGISQMTVSRIERQALAVLHDTITGQE